VALPPGEYHLRRLLRKLTIFQVPLPKEPFAIFFRLTWRAPPTPGSLFRDQCRVKCRSDPLVLSDPAVVRLFFSHLMLRDCRAPDTRRPHLFWFPLLCFWYSPFLGTESGLPQALSAAVLPPSQPPRVSQMPRRIFFLLSQRLQPLPLFNVGLSCSPLICFLNCPGPSTCFASAQYRFGVGLHCGLCFRRICVLCFRPLVSDFLSHRRSWLARP